MPLGGRKRKRSLHEPADICSEDMDTDFSRVAPFVRNCTHVADGGRGDPEAACAAQTVARFLRRRSLAILCLQVKILNGDRLFGSRCGAPHDKIVEVEMMLAFRGET